MAQVKLKTKDGTEFQFIDGEVKRVTSKIISNIEAQEIPGVGPREADVFDYQGPVKNITLTGILFSNGLTRINGASIITIIQQKQWLESLINGTQEYIILTSNYESTSISSKLGATFPYQGGFKETRCYVQDLTFDEIEALTEELAFSMTLIVGN